MSNQIKRPSNRKGIPNKVRQPAHPARQFELLSSNQWLLNRQVAYIFGWSSTKTTLEIKKIKKEIEKRGGKTLYGCISTQAIIDYYGLDVQKIFKTAKQLMELEKFKAA